MFACQNLNLFICVVGSLFSDSPRSLEATFIWFVPRRTLIAIRTPERWFIDDLTQYQKIFAFLIETKPGSIHQFVMSSLASMGIFIRICYKLMKGSKLAGVELVDKIESPGAQGHFFCFNEKSGEA